MDDTLKMYANDYDFSDDEIEMITELEIDETRKKFKIDPIELMFRNDDENLVISADDMNIEDLIDFENEEDSNELNIIDVTFNQAYENNDIDTVISLIDDVSINTLSDLLMTLLANSKNIELFTTIVNQVDPSFNDNYLMQSICIHNLKDFCKIVLNHPKLNISDDLSELFKLCNEYNSEDVLKLIVSSNKVGMKEKIEICLTKTECFYFDIIYGLIENHKENDNKLLSICCEFGFPSVLERLSKKSDYDPTVNDNCALILAVTNKHYSIVKILLDDLRIYPSFDDNMALNLAIDCEAKEIIDLFLENPRTNLHNVNQFLRIKAYDLRLVNIINKVFSIEEITVQIFSYIPQSLAISKIIWKYTETEKTYKNKLVRFIPQIKINHINLIERIKTLPNVDLISLSDITYINDEITQKLIKNMKLEGDTSALSLFFTKCKILNECYKDVFIEKFFDTNIFEPVGSKYEKNIKVLRKYFTITKSSSGLYKIDYTGIDLHKFYNNKICMFHKSGYYINDKNTEDMMIALMLNNKNVFNEILQRNDLNLNRIILSGDISLPFCGRDSKTDLVSILLPYLITSTQLKLFEILYKKYRSHFLTPETEEKCIIYIIHNGLVDYFKLLIHKLESQDDLIEYIALRNTNNVSCIKMIILLYKKLSSEKKSCLFARFICNGDDELLQYTKYHLT